MRRFLSAFFFLVSLTLGAQETVGSSLRVSLLTCSKGDEIASDFGHSAIRIRDAVSGQDLVFNFGTYDFEAPHFVLKFMRGQMDYLLSVCHFEGFLDSYLLENRAVSERELLLPPESRMKIYTHLVSLYNGSGRRYRYDYFRNNCATRIRDILLGEGSVIPRLQKPAHEAEYTFRSAYGSLYLEEEPWLMFGLDLLMGARLDRPISFEEEMYLPCLLEKNLSECRFADSGSPLLGEEIPLLGDCPEERGRWTFLYGPMSVFSAVFLFLAVLLFVLRGRPCFLRMLSSLVYTVIGLTGVLLLLMWFCTEHYWTGVNWNLLWANPLYLIPAFMHGGRARNWMVYILTSMSVLAVALQFFIPQPFNDADIPIVAIMALPAVGIYMEH
ncbi:MAG: DUF4105 domain-containing protein [Alistipes sp.]|nr:DUF4105 domain-containing protein [Candidatus Minthomonas equi]